MHVNFATHTSAAWLILGALVFSQSGCNSTAGGRSAASTPEINMNCLGDHISSPTDSFHYSFKATDEQNAVDKEAEVTPQTMEVTIQDKTGSHTSHGTRSDQSSWDRAVLDLSGSGMTVMIARIAFLTDRNASSVKQLDSGATNGYAAIHYAIDTGSANEADKRTLATMFGAGSGDKGEIWTTPDGCPVKLLLDESKQMPNGSVGKTHFEINVIKK